MLGPHASLPPTYLSFAESTLEKITEEIDTTQVRINNYIEKYKLTS